MVHQRLIEAIIDAARYDYRRVLSRKQLLPDGASVEQLRAIIKELPWSHCPACTQLFLALSAEPEVDYLGLCAECRQYAREDRRRHFKHGR